MSRSAIENAAFLAVSPPCPQPIAERTKGGAMPRGTLKWFEPSLGYGYITPSDGGRDIRVPTAALTNVGVVRAGLPVRYEVLAKPGFEPLATQVTVVGSASRLSRERVRSDSAA